MATPTPSPALQPQSPPKQDWLDLTVRLATSWTGALTAYIAAVLLALTNIEQLKKGLASLNLPPWAGLVIIFAPPLLALLFSTIPKFLEERRIKRYSELTGAIQPGYFTLRPREDEATFTRADNAHHEILRWMQHTSEPVLYLTGASGTGKSSILSAWVLPKLKQEKHRVIQLRGYEPDLPARIKEQLLQPGLIWEKPPANPENLFTLFQRAMQRLAPSGSRLFIVIDQFEEFLILADSERQNTLRELLRTTSIPNLSFVLVYRPEYEHLLDEHSQPQIPWPQLKLEINRKVVGAFTENASNDFINKSNLTVNPDLLRGVLREAAEIDQTAGLIRPVTLNLCGLVLSRFTSGLPGRFRSSLIRGFLRESLALPEVLEVANKLIPHLITEDITKQPRTLTDLANATHVAPFTIRACLRRLGEPDRGILRPIDQDQQTWEISHDFLVPLLDNIVARRTVSWWRALRPWLPWATTAALALATLLIPMLRQEDPAVGLRKLGWQISENRGVLVLKAKRAQNLGPESIAILRGLRFSFSLDLSDTNAADLSPLKDLNSLASLNLSSTQVKDLSALKDLKFLSSLDLNDTNVNDLSPLKDLKSLSSLNLSLTDVTDISPLKNLTSLSSLVLSDTEVTDLSPLKNLKSLSSLVLSDTNVTDVSPLKDLKSLSSLDLRSTNVTDLSPLKDLKSLSSLVLGDTNVKDLSPLKDLKSLSSLVLSDTNAADLSPIKDLKSLSSLDLRLTNVKDLSPLKDLKSLSSLSLSATKVTDLSPLKDLESLSSLDLRLTNVIDLSALKDLKSLSSLDLRLTKVTDLSPLRDLKSLSSLVLGANRAIDLSPLKDLVSLKIIRSPE